MLNKILHAGALSITLIIILAFILMAAPMPQIVGAQDGLSPDLSSPTILSIIEYLDRLLTNKSLSQGSRQNIELRKSYFVWQATQKAMPTANPVQIIAQKQTLAAKATQQGSSMTPVLTNSRPTGILKGSAYVRHLASEAKIVDVFWIGRTESSYATVYTGNLRIDPTQGVLYVFPEDVGSWLKFLSPKKLGAMQIVDYKGNRLILATESGETLYFDVAALTFISSLDEVLPLVETSVQLTPYP